MRRSTLAAVLVAATAVVAAAGAGCGDNLTPGLGDDTPEPGTVDAANQQMPGPHEPDAAPGTPDASVPGTPDAAPPSPLCAAAQWPPGTDKTVTIKVGGVDRSYVVRVGDAVAAAQPAALMLNFHGHNNSAFLQELFSRMRPIANKEGFIVAYPKGVSASFNAGTCCSPADDDKVDDVGFARAIVEDVAAHACVDRKRVYATGFSNGGMMAHRLACEAADVFAAVAVVAGENVSPTCMPRRAVPVIAFHGDADKTVEPASGLKAIAGWVLRDACGLRPTRTMYGKSYCDRWTGCRGGAAVEWCSIAGLNHFWPGAQSEHPASPAIWAFLKGYTLP